MFTNLVSLAAVLMMWGLLSGCGKLQNAISELSLDCGQDAISQQSYVKILDPRDDELRADQLLVWRLASSGTRSLESSTSRGCVKTADLESGALLITTTYTDRSWGTILEAHDLPLFMRRQLVDTNNVDLRAQCPVNPHVRSSVPLPVAWPEELTLALPATYSVEQDGTVFTSRQELSLTDDGHIELPSGLRNGSFQISVNYENLFRSADAKLVGRSVQCSYVFDDQLPRLSDSLDIPFASDLFQVKPGERISFRVDDANPGAVHYCLRSFAESDACEDDSSFTPMLLDGTVQAPEAGKWCLATYAVDKSGNRSETRSTCFISYQASKIESISTLATTSRAVVATDQLAAAVMAIKALRYYFELPTDEEKSLVHDQVLSSINSVASLAFEENRQLQPGNAVAIDTIGSDGNVASLHGNGLEILGPDAEAIHSHPFASPLGQSIKDSSILLYGRDALEILRYTEQGLSPVKIDAIPEGFRIAAATWNPAADEFVLVRYNQFHDQALSVLIYRRSGDLYQLVQNFESHNPGSFDAILWADSGRFLGLVERDGFTLLQRTEEGLFEDFDNSNVGYYQGKVSGASFLTVAGKDIALLINDEGQLRRWNETVGFQDVGASAEAAPGSSDPSQGSLSAILRKATDEAFLLRGEQIEVVHVGEQGVEVISELKVDPRRVMDWKWSADAEILSVNSIDPPYTAENIGSTTFRLIEVPGRLPRRGLLQEHHSSRHIFQKTLYIAATGKSLAVDIARYRHLWNPLPIADSFRIPSLNATVDWFSLDGVMHLAIGTYQGFLDVFGQDGKLAKRFPHALPERPAPVNDAVDHPNEGKIVTIAEDGRAVVWDRVTGRQIAVLDETQNLGGAGSAGGLLLRDAVIASENFRTIVTVGRRDLAIWKQDEGVETYSLSSRINLRIPAIHRPGDVRFVARGQETLIWYSNSTIRPLAYRFYTLDGKEVTFEGELGATQVQYARWDDQGAQLATIGLDGQFQVYAALNGSFTKVAAVPEKFPSTLERLVWSPDGKKIFAHFTDDQFVLFARQGAQVAVLAKQKIESGLQIGHIRWSANSELIAFSDRDEMHVLNTRLDTFSRIQVRPDKATYPALSPFLGSDRLAIVDAPMVSFIDLRLSQKTLHKFCSRLETFLSQSNEFERSPYLTEADRAVCSSL